MWYYFVSPAITLLTMLVGLGVIYGALKTTINHLKDQVDRLSESADDLKDWFTTLREEVHVKFAQHELKKTTTRRRKRK